ncbi:uncharacterized protein LOC142318993 isoform X2 [Lycorma delicatula]|uniref:uncharacterized protein LOC142318993 isoform X2 n=1 Tax=Lycorma delicatula TaxID=130591 RepID=UPI003F513AB1
MAQAVFDVLNGDVTIDEDDLFQCGKCKVQFTSFAEFFAHKKTHSSVRLEAMSSKGVESSGLMYSEIVPEQTFTQPILATNCTLSDSGFLSLNMDQGPLNIAATSQVFDGCGAYLTSSTNQEQTTFQIPTTVPPEEVTVSTATTAAGAETLREQQKEITGANTITVSVVGAVHDQINGDVRNCEMSKDADSATGKLKCVYCGKSFSKNFDLQQHVRSHTGERPFQCVVCGRAFSQKSNVKKHMASHKVWPKRIRTLSTDPVSPSQKISIESVESQNSESKDEDTENGKASEQIVAKSYVCQYCPALFKNYFELKTHRKVHIHQKVYRCIQKNCNETFSDLDDFLYHTQIHENEAQYHCHVCNKEFTSLDELGTHQYSHSVPTHKFTPRIVSCKKCKSKFANLEGLERHMVQDSHTYPCPQCNKVFACERFLRRHLTTHSTTLPYVCQHCSKAFKTEQYLNMHLIIHSNEKPFTCQHCTAAFNRRDKLARHNLIHENLRKYKCPFSKHLGCTKAFNRKDKLKAHMLTHSTKLKHLCSACGRIFQKQAHLKQHEKICTQAQKSAAKSVNSSSSNPEASKVKEINFLSLKNEIEMQNDNMSTIEIVVVPVERQHLVNKNSDTFRVTFPAAAAVSNSIDLSQAVVTPDQEVPVFKSLPSVTNTS